MPRVVVIRTSARRRSNSSALADAAAEAALENGADVEVVDLPARHVEPCPACGECESSGACVEMADDAVSILESIREAGRLVIASPVYFMGAPAKLKALIDRSQYLYHRKYRLRERLGPDELALRRGALIVVAGSKLENVFDGIELTVRYFLDSLQIPLVEKLGVKGVDRAGAILERPDALAEARRIGHAISS